MRPDILPIAKSAMKYFFDIDPVLTESVLLQAFTTGQVITKEFRHAIASKGKKNSSVYNYLILPDTTSYNAA